MQVDEWIRWIVVSLIGLGVLVWMVGGFWTSVAGPWRDGERTVKLSQWGPWVWGEACWQAGRQAYHGRIGWGRLHLWRYDEGAQHLAELGFTSQQMKLLAGKATGQLRMRLAGDALKGSFYGCKFSFDNDRILSTTWVSPSPRIWKRVV